MSYKTEVIEALEVYKRNTAHVLGGDSDMVRAIDRCIALTNEVKEEPPERLTDDDFETIRIHLNAYKENLCNQRRWKEAEEYQRIIDRFMGFASAQPEPKTGKWKETDDGWDGTYYVCSECGCPWTLIDGTPLDNGMNYCPNCGCKMEMEAER